MCPLLPFSPPFLQEVVIDVRPKCHPVMVPLCKSISPYLVVFSTGVTWNILQLTYNNLSFCKETESYIFSRKFALSEMAPPRWQTSSFPRFPRDVTAYRWPFWVFNVHRKRMRRWIMRVFRAQVRILSDWTWWEPGLRATAASSSLHLRNNTIKRNTVRH